MAYSNLSEELMTERKRFYFLSGVLTAFILFGTCVFSGHSTALTTDVSERGLVGYEYDGEDDELDFDDEDDEEDSDEDDDEDGTDDSDMSDEERELRRTTRRSRSRRKTTFKTTSKLTDAKACKYYCESGAVPTGKIYTDTKLSGSGSQGRFICYSKVGNTKDYTSSNDATYPANPQVWSKTYARYERAQYGPKGNYYSECQAWWTTYETAYPKVKGWFRFDVTKGKPQTDRATLKASVTASDGNNCVAKGKGQRYTVAAVAFNSKLTSKNCYIYAPKPNPGNRRLTLEVKVDGVGVDWTTYRD